MQPHLFLLSLLFDHGFCKFSWINNAILISNPRYANNANVLKFYTAACCSLLSLTINLSGREGVTYNVFSGEYQVTDNYTDNGEQLLFLKKICIFCVMLLFFSKILRDVPSVPEQVETKTINCSCSKAQALKTSMTDRTCCFSLTSILFVLIL